MIKLSLKKANLSHEYILYKWHNLKSVLKYSLDQNKVSLKDHKKWYKKQLKSKNILKIIYLNKIPIGFVRLDKKRSFYLINYMIIPRFRKKGYASKALKKIIVDFNYQNKHKLVAIVKKNNIPSLKIFKKLNFFETKDLENKKNIKFELNK